jgi:peptide/nickel transport system substrate-binding protein
MRRIVLLACVVLAACTGDRGPKFGRAGNTAPRDGGTLRHSTIYNLRTLDPAIAYDDVSTPMLHALFDTLVDYGPDLALVPRLAERWTVSPDGLVYSFAIRPGVTFSDGSPLTAADCAYSLERVRKMTDSPFTTFLADVATIATPAPDRLEITLATANAAFLYVLATAAW